MFKGIAFLIKNNPIKRTVFISYVVLVIFFVASASLFFYHNSINLSVEQTNRQTLIMLNELSTRASAVADELMNVCISISNEDDLKYNLMRFSAADVSGQLDIDYSIKQTIRNYWKLKPNIFNISILVNNMKYSKHEKNSIYPLEEVIATEGDGIFKGQQSILLDTHVLPRKVMYGAHSITGLIKVNDPKGYCMGEIAVDILESDFYNSLLKRNKITKGSFVYVINEEGEVVSSEDKGNIGEKLEIENLPKILQSPDSYLENASINHKEFLIICSKKGKIGWRVLELIPKNELYIGLDRIRISIATIAAVLIVLLIPLSSFLSKFITRPIIHLANSMKRFRIENIKDKLTTDYNNEIGELTSSYNTMMDKIDSLIIDIHKSNDLKRQSDIKALQAQINPHFLYNTLEFISWSAMDSNAEHISEMVIMLSRLFRLGLNKGRSICRVCDEIEHVRYYMQIHKLCKMSNFEYSFEVDDSLKNLNVPKLILQPLVENSIIHGFGKEIKDGRIDIRVFARESKLIMEVEDNGVGIPDEIAENILSMDSQKGGYGVKNVNQRIGFVCGKQFGISYIKGNTQGTLARVILPPDLREESEFI